MECWASGNSQTSRHATPEIGTGRVMLWHLLSMLLGLGHYPWCAQSSPVRQHESTWPTFADPSIYIFIYIYIVSFKLHWEKQKWNKHLSNHSQRYIQSNGNVRWDHTIWCLAGLSSGPSQPLGSSQLCGVKHCRPAEVGRGWDGTCSYESRTEQNGLVWLNLSVEISNLV